MHAKRVKSIALAGVVVSMCLALDASAMEMLGKKPSHVSAGPSSVENEQAITRMIWAPGIDDGYVPQGVAWAEGALYLSGYRSTDMGIGRGPCRVFKIDPRSGATLGQMDLPADCGHAGGLAYAGKGVLIAADTRRLYKIDLASAFAPGGAPGAISATVTLGGELKGSFADFDGSSVFIGRYDKNPAKAKGHYLPLSIFDTHNGRTVSETEVSRSIPLPPRAQGAGFDKDGNLWVTASGSWFGTLYRLDGKTGQAVASFDMVIGIEDLAFDDDGRLWSVSEAGSLRWKIWSATFPVLFQVDPARLKKSP